MSGYEVMPGDTPAYIATKLTGDWRRFGELVAANPHKARQVAGGAHTFADLKAGEVLAVPRHWGSGSGTSMKAAGLGQDAHGRHAHGHLSRDGHGWANFRHEGSLNLAYVGAVEVEDCAWHFLAEVMSITDWPADYPHEVGVHAVKLIGHPGTHYMRSEAGYFMFRCAGASCEVFVCPTDVNPVGLAQVGLAQTAKASRQSRQSGTKHSGTRQQGVAQPVSGEGNPDPPTGFPNPWGGPSGSGDPGSSGGSSGGGSGSSGSTGGSSGSSGSSGGGTPSLPSGPSGPSAPITPSGGGGGPAPGLVNTSATTSSSSNTGLLVVGGIAVVAGLAGFAYLAHKKTTEGSGSRGSRR